MNPKLGLVWPITSSTTARVAAFRTLKRSLLTNQTIEPTQVAGFNQFFDDFTGADAWHYGIAVDHKFSNVFYGGLEFFARELEIPRPRDQSGNWDEQAYRAYLDWAPHAMISTKLSYQLQRFDVDKQFGGIIPDILTTHLGEASVRFFHPSGFLSHLEVQYVNQKVVDAELFIPSSLQNQFVTVNAGLGYRLPKRYGVLRLDVRNLLDEHFNYQSLGDLTRGEDVSPFIPERSVFAYFTVAF